MQSKLLRATVVAWAALAMGATAQDKKPTVPLKALPIQPGGGPVQQGGAQKAPSQQDLIKLRDEKMALPVFKKAGWTFDYDKARAEAKKSGKLIFTYFSRSYAH